MFVQTVVLAFVYVCLTMNLSILGQLDVFCNFFAVENMKAWFHTQWNITIWAIVRSKLAFAIFNSSKNLFALSFAKIASKT